LDVDSTWATLAVLLGALLIYTVIAVADAALETISHTRLRLLAERNVSGASHALQLLDDRPRLHMSLSLLRLLLLVSITAAVLTLSQQTGGSPFVAAIAVWAMMILLWIGAAAIGARGYLRIAPALAPLLRVLVLLISPLRALIQGLQQRVVGTSREDEELLRLTEEERRALMSMVGDHEGELPEEGREMIYSIVALGQTTVREVMVPRPDVVALRSDSTLQEALDTVIQEGHSRIPVYEENIDNIVGILYAKDLIGYLRDNRTDVPLRDMLRPAIYVPSSKMADELLHDLQRRRVHLAIVFDEYGGTAGLVTIEDLLEEIVGEIQDEYDEEEAAFDPLNEYEAAVSGRFDIDDLNREMGLDLPTDENDTVGGLVYSALGRVPLLHDEVRLDEEGVTFRVTAMAGRRILKVRVKTDQPTLEEQLDDVIVDGSAEELPPPSRGGAGMSASRMLFW
jgi:CBS domain containing-hemolysin-like protein